MTNAEKIAQIVDEINAVFIKMMLAEEIEGRCHDEYQKRELPKRVMPKMGYDEAQEKVLQAIGHASVCWDKEGVFDSEQAINVCDDLLQSLGYEKEKP